MKRIFTIAAVVALLAAVFVVEVHYHARRVEAQASVIPFVPGNPNALSFAAGVYFSPMYNWRGLSETGITATGSQTIIIGPSVVTLPDGRLFHPFGAADNQLTSVTFDQGAVQETVTPSAVSVLDCPVTGDFPQPARCISFTGTFSNTHPGTHTIVASGSQGINEAIADAGSNGGGLVYWRIDPGIVTLNTAGATTSLGSVNIPTRSIVLTASARVTTTIGTCAGGWSLGLAGGSGTDLTAPNTTLTAGTTTDSSTIKTPVNSGALAAGAPTAFCTTSNASAGAVHAKFDGYKIVAPLS